MIDEWKAINIIAERAYENRKQLKQARRQRRTEFVDIYGVPMPLEYIKTKDGFRYYETRLYVSNDLEYWERFQFKIEALFDGEINENDFQFLIGERDEVDGSDSDLIDISDYLRSQNGIWIEESGYYPSDETVDETDDDDEEDVYDDAGFFFDILEACTLLWAEDDTSAVHEITRAGTKIVQVRIPKEADITFIPFIKYSTINR